MAGRERLGEVRRVRAVRRGVSGPTPSISRRGRNDGSVQAGPRYASVYQIHKTPVHLLWVLAKKRAPVGAIFHGQGNYELAVYSKDDFVWDKTRPAHAGVHRDRLPGTRLGHVG